MTRAFYPVSRKHHAVSMAIDFGMRFKMRNGFWTPEGLLAITGAGDYRIEVAEESLYLLEPILNDVICTVREGFYEVQRICDVYDKPARNTWKLHQIIQRNGLPFHWPQQEPPQV